MFEVIECSRRDLQRADSEIRESVSAPKTALWGSAGIRLAALALAGGACLLQSRSAGAEVAALEYKVKAGYLYNFAKLVEWPAAALPAPDSPIVIGVLGGGEALPIMRPLLEGKIVNGRPVQVKEVTANRLGSGIHILFVTREAGTPPEQVREALGGAPTLLVGETDGFAQRGGMLNFVIMEGRVKFEVNLDAAARSHLSPGSQLLKLAILVEDGTPPRKE